MAAAAACVLFFIAGALYVGGAPAPDIWFSALGGLGAAGIFAYSRRPVSVALFLLLYIGLTIGALLEDWVPSAGLLLAMALVPVCWLRFAKRMELRAVGEWLGLHGRGLWPNIALGALFAALLFTVSILEAVILEAAGVTDIANVQRLVQKATLASLALSLTLGPLAEEVFFRGWLQRSLSGPSAAAGLVATSALFAVFHAAYGSWAELLGAFTAGLLFGWLRLRTGSLVGPITAHALYNAVALSALLR